MDKLTLPDGQETDDLETALKFYDASKQRIQEFLQNFEKQEHDRTNSLMAAFAAQKEPAHCQEQLTPLPKYLELSSHNQTAPDWKWLHEIIAWRDLFERLRGQQKLDIDGQVWSNLRDRLQNHQRKESWRQSTRRARRINFNFFCRPYRAWNCFDG